MSTFVSIGNATQPFKRLLDAVAELAPRLPQPVIIQHGSTPFGAGNCQCVPFMSMSAFADHVCSARLLIFHAGAGSVIHAVNVGKTPVVVPRLRQYGEHIDDHQLEFALAVERLGKIIIAREAAELSDAVQEALRRTQRPMSTIAEPRILRLIHDALRGYAEEA